LEHDGRRRSGLHSDHVLHNRVLLAITVARQAIIVGTVQEAPYRSTTGVCAAMVGSLRFLPDSKSVLLRLCLLLTTMCSRSWDV
jgi:hypothetical protein